MRRRYVRYIPPEPATDRSTILLMAAGAVAGAAAGLFLGRRYGSVGAFLDDAKERIDQIREAWDDDLEDEEDVVALAPGADEEDEKAEADDDGIVSESDEWEEDEEDEEDEWDEEDDEDENDEVDDDEDDDEEDLDAELEDDEESDDREEGIAQVAGSNGTSPEADASNERAARRLETRVLHALGDDRRLRARAIEIAVVGDGVVELTGSVRSIDEISRAAALVRKVPGVTMVLNRIEVRAAGHVDTASVPRNTVGGTPAPDQPSEDR